jgi:DNA-binding Xre family transcriptional regulator
MTNNKSALKKTFMNLQEDNSPSPTKEFIIKQKNGVLNEEEYAQKVFIDNAVEIEDDTAGEEKNQSKEKKKKRGRPATTHKVTKIHLLLEKRGMSRKQLNDLISSKYPDEPVSPDAVSRIVSGRREHYSTSTLYRICGALNVTPNQILDYEDYIK